MTCLGSSAPESELFSAGLGPDCRPQKLNDSYATRVKKLYSR